MSTIRTALVAAALFTMGCAGCGPDDDNNGPSSCGDERCAADAICVDDACECRPGFEGDGQSCEAVVVACETDDVCGPGRCDGGFCVCDDGYALDAAGCVDVDECAANLDDCDPAATCTNTAGGFDCACPGSTPGDGRTCDPFDECAAGTDDCVGEHAVCIDLDDGYECGCDDGFTGDGESCSVLVDCNADPAACDEDATCTDTPDGTACVCDDGFAGDGASCRQTGFTKIVAAESAVCGLRPDGTMACWGRKVPGASQEQSLHGATVPTAEPSGAVWATVDIQTYGVVAVRDDGTVWRAGNDADFQQIDTADDWVDVRFDSNILDLHYCGIKTDETLWCWGENGHGQVGVGGTEDVMEPTQIGTATWRHVEVGHARACGVQTDGTLWCWGGAGARGPEVFSDVPVQVGTATDWSEVRMRVFDNVAVRDDGRVFTWTGHVADPMQEGTDTWKAFGRGNYAQCGVKTDGTLWCRGANVFGALGDPDLVQTGIEFTQLGTDSDWADLVLTQQHFCALKSGGDAYCWGRNSLGQVGVGTRPVAFAPQTVGAGASFADVSISQAHSCAIRADGSLACTGDNTLSALGVPTMELFGADEYRVVHPGPWEDVAVGGQHTCVIGGGELACFGATNQGQSGRGQGATPTHEPTPVDDATDWERVVATNGSTCAIKETGELYCWGQNRSGILGTGDEEMKWLPTQVPGTWKQVTGSAQVSTTHTCGIQTDDTLWCWGDNTAGQLGTGDTGATLTPAQVDDSTWRDVSVGYETTFAVKTDGTLWWWGNLAVYGISGEQVVPVQLGTATDWDVVAGTQQHACATREDGSLFCWGQTFGGMTGQPGELMGVLMEPTRVGTASNWTDVVVTLQATCGLQDDGGMSCWGTEQIGNLGYGTGWYDVPTKVRD